MKKVVEKVEMVIDAQKSFAQVYEDRYMNKRIRGKMMKLDPIIIQESRKKLELERPNPHSKYGTNPIISPVFSYGQASPSAGRHWITDIDGKKPCLTTNSKSDLEHLLDSQPSSWVGSAAAPFPLLDFFGAIWKSTERFMRIH